jgi:hypothetical protein
LRKDSPALNLFGHARKMLQGLSPPEPGPPQYYDVACIEGHRLQGQRREGYQALRCPECGEGLFVLPESPLPDPPAPKEKAKHVEPAHDSIDDGPIALADPPAQSGAVDEPDAEVEWIDDAPPEEAAASAPPHDDGFESIIPEREEPEPVRPASPRQGGRSKQAAAEGTPEVATQTHTQKDRRRHHRETPAPAQVEPAIAVAARPSFKQWLKRRQPLILVALVGLLVAATIGTRLWKNRIANLPQVAETNLAEGTEAMDERGDFITAKLKLNVAAAALEQLGDDKAPAVRQKADEAAILADRVEPSIEEVLLKATRSSTVDEWKTEFERDYKGRALAIDAAFDEDKRRGGLKLNYTVIAGPAAKPVVGWIDIKGLALMEAKAYKKGDTITFGARLAGILLETDGSWRIALQPESGVFLNDRKALALIPEFGVAKGDSGEEGGP